MRFLHALLARIHARLHKQHFSAERVGTITNPLMQIVDQLDAHRTAAVVRRDELVAQLADVDGGLSDAKRISDRLYNLLHNDDAADKAEANVPQT